MTMNNRSDLPKDVQNSLPEAGQQLYLNAYNEAYKSYEQEKVENKDADREEMAHRQAWAAVREVYELQGNRWVQIKDIR